MKIISIVYIVVLLLAALATLVLSDVCKYYRTKMIQAISYAEILTNNNIYNTLEKVGFACLSVWLVLSIAGSVGIVVDIIYLIVVGRIKDVLECILWKVVLLSVNAINILNGR